MYLNNSFSQIKNSLSSFTSFAFVFTLIIAFVIAGCGGSSTGVNGTNGNGNGNGSGNGGPEIGTSPTFDNVGQLFMNHCADCHTSQRESGVRLNTYSNVIESVGDQYGTLVVQPGNANASPLVDKIESSNPTFGERMPEGGPFLSNARIDQIKAWINNGAENDQSEGSEGDDDDNGDDDDDDDGY